MDVELELPLQDDPVSLVSAASRLRHGSAPGGKARRTPRDRRGVGHHRSPPPSARADGVSAVPAEPVVVTAPLVTLARDHRRGQTLPGNGSNTEPSLRVRALSVAGRSSAESIPAGPSR